MLEQLCPVFNTITTFWTTHLQVHPLPHLVVDEDASQVDQSLDDNEVTLDTGGPEVEVEFQQSSWH